MDLLFPDMKSCMDACVGQPPVLGGCEGTRYGCCPDGKTPKGIDDSCDEASQGHPPNKGVYVFCAHACVRVCVSEYIES